MDMMTSLKTAQYPMFSVKWLKAVLAETLRAAGAALIWIITLTCAAFTMLCVTAWDAMRG